MKIALAVLEIVSGTIFVLAIMVAIGKSNARHPTRAIDEAHGPTDPALVAPIARPPARATPNRSPRRRALVEARQRLRS
jgi:hypothetical protein